VSHYIYVVCVMCKTRMGRLARYCKQCGRRLPVHEQPPELEEQIEYNSQICSGENHEMMKTLFAIKFCPVCGVNL